MKKKKYSDFYQDFLWILQVQFTLWRWKIVVIKAPFKFSKLVNYPFQESGAKKQGEGGGAKNGKIRDAQKVHGFYKFKKILLFRKRLKI